MVRLVNNFVAQTDFETTPTMQQIVQLFRGNHLKKFTSDGFPHRDGFNAAWINRGMSLLFSLKNNFHIW